MPRKSLITAVVAVLAALAFAPAATADKPIIEPAPFGEFTGAYCDDFDVRVRETEARGKAIIFSSGAVIVTGMLKVEVTNLETDKTIALNISGPGFFTPDGTTLRGSGPWLFFGEPGFFGPGSPATLETVSGRIVINLVDGSFVSRVGHRVELCPLLSG